MRIRLSRRVTAGSVALLITGAGVAVASPAMASYPARAYSNGGNPSNCLDAAIANINSNGDPVTLQPCTGALNQKWYISPVNGTGYPAEIVNAASGLCLDADNNHINTNGDIVQLWACWGGLNQQWNFGWQGGPGPERVNVASGLCLDADNNHINTNGDIVQLWSCWNGLNQQWNIIAP